MKITTILFTSALLLQMGCATQQGVSSQMDPASISTPSSYDHTQYLELYEAGLRSRYCLGSEHINKSVCYLSIGWDHEKEIWVDPPQEILERLADMDLLFQKASEMSGNRPGDFAQAMDDNGKRCSIFYLQIQNVIDMKTVEVRIGYSTGPLAAFSVLTTARRNENGSWSFDLPNTIIMSKKQNTPTIGPTELRARGPVA